MQDGREQRCMMEGKRGAGWTGREDKGGRSAGVQGYRWRSAGGRMGRCSSSGWKGCRGTGLGNAGVQNGGMEVCRMKGCRMEGCTGAG